ncbi:MAG: hypothetical protein ACKOYN_03990, partial [Planctomycetota bacterium]
GDTMRVRVSMGAAGFALRGADLRIVFDAARLSFAAGSTVAGSPYTLETAETADNAAGTLRFAVSVAAQAAGNASACAVADLDFTVLAGASDCAASGLVGFGTVGGATTTMPTATTVAMRPAVSALGAVAIDSVSPVLAGVPAAVACAADAGTTLGAFVAALTVSASDDCSAAPAVALSILYPDGSTASAWPSHGYFPVGQSTLAFSAADAAGNAVSAVRTVTVAAHQLADIDVTLAGVVSGDSTRSIRVRAGSSVQTLQVPFARESAAMAGVQVPVSAAYPCILVKDGVHSLTRAAAASVDGVRWTIDATLVQGDSNDDDFIDVLDFGLFIGDIGLDPTRSGVSNFNADIAVNTGDFAFIGLGFLSSGESCGGFVDGMPRDRVSVRELRRRGLGELIRADLNGDGWLDTDDIALSMQGN